MLISSGDGEIFVMRISDRGLAFTAGIEGFSAVIYDDNGHPAIGCGHDIQPGETFPGTLTKPEALQLLSQDMATRYEPALNSLIPEDCTQNQFDALADFAYSEGDGALAILLGHGWDQVTTQLPKWCYEHVNGILTRSEGLLDRRKKEIAMFENQG
jgi:GH24 family phage-related lysozyme (muramidase)